MERKIEVRNQDRYKLPRHCRRSSVTFKAISSERQGEEVTFEGEISKEGIFVKRLTRLKSSSKGF